jgi:glycosyltransferase involved in cell wall biosynthesis
MHREIPILQVISTNGYFGAERVMRDLSCAIRDLRGWPVRVFLIDNGDLGTSKTADAFRAGKFDMDVVRSEGKYDRRAIRRLSTVMSEHGTRIVHSHNYKSNAYSCAAAGIARALRVKLVSTCHNWIETDLKTRVYGRIDRYLLRRFDSVVAVSESVQERLRESGVHPDRTFLIENTIYLPAGQPDTMRTPGAGGNGILTVAFVGRISEEKGISFLIEAVAELQRESAGICLRILGDGPCRREYEDLSNRKCLPGSVDWMGFRNDVPEQLSRVDVFVLPSRIEASPIVLLEAMERGNAIIASRVGGIPGRIEDGRNGLLVTPCDTKELVKALRYLLQNPDARRDLGKNARESFLRYARQCRTFERYVEIYESLVHAA